MSYQASVRVDTVSLAKCLSFYMKNGVHIKTTSHLISLIVKDLAELLAKNEQTANLTEEQALLMLNQFAGKVSDTNIREAIKVSNIITESPDIEGLQKALERYKDEQ